MISFDKNCISRLKVLTDKTRFMVLQQLYKGPKHVAELNQSIDVEQSLLSHHLKILKQAGLVKCQRDGKAMLYQITHPLSNNESEEINLGCCTLSFPSKS
ncbi:MAG: winged helix-turn-helix transcriptional regulator [Methylococcales bacterium]|jgi:ArsR family transcriptional regulator, nickel/cobalt-responsive transcriptional repressor|nr:winged helix-turn-helix transcriptional regulator [Methylococcales bacterium]